MSEKKKTGAEPIEGFLIKKEKPHISEFDEDLKQKDNSSKDDAA
jgi:hypothetical protein